MQPAQPSPETIAKAAALLRAGRLVAFPTETVYGLGADATNGVAVARLYEAKGRPSFNPLIAAVADLASVEALAVLSGPARRLAEALWPGPLTLVLPARPGNGIADLVTAGLETIAVRIPSHPVALALVEALGRPITAPSANRSGHLSPTTAAHVVSDLGDRVSLVIDGGPTMHGLESTIVDAAGDAIRILRPGAVPRERIEAIAGRALPADPASPPARAPVRPEGHSAPQAAIRLEARDVRPGEALIAFGPDLPAHDGPCLNLSRSGDLVEAAANLFSALRQMEAAGASRIAVMPIPEHGLGAAINDRLRRAAAPRRAPPSGEDDTPA